MQSLLGVAFIDDFPFLAGARRPWSCCFPNTKQETQPKKATFCRGLTGVESCEIFSLKSVKGGQNIIGKLRHVECIRFGSFNRAHEVVRETKFSCCPYQGQTMTRFKFRDTPKFLQFLLPVFGAESGRSLPSFSRFVDVVQSTACQQQQQPNIISLSFFHILHCQSLSLSLHHGE